MAEYHVGCGLFGNVYAGTYAPPRKDGLQAWRNKSEVTSEALLMARALLPDETDEGTMLHWENFIYTVIE